MPQNDPPYVTDTTPTADARSTQGELSPERTLCTFESFDYDSDDDAYRVLFDPDTVAPSTAIVSAIAAISDTDPVEVEPLYSVVDPDCLDSIASNQPPKGDVEVTFQLDGYPIRVKSSGSIEITPP